MIKDRVVLLGVAGLAAVATAGWMRQPSASAATPLVNSFQMMPAEAPITTPVSAAQFTPVSHTAAQPVYRPVSRANNAVRRANPAYDDTRAVRTSSAAYGETRGRSKKASAAIIGGGAAAGAAIGGLAGGGKGAVIGAVGGGAAGLVYDRMTAKKSGSSEDYRYRSTGREDVRQERSGLERAAIIGGSAAAGAAVGGAAGGGKGAAIGAVAGGAGGYIYDRMTKNR
jgi:hypothetical protein